MFSSRQSIMPLRGPAGRESMRDPGLADAQEYAQCAERVMQKMIRCRDASYGAASCLRSEALQIERMHEVIQCTEYAVLVREDATRRHQEHLKASIEPQIHELLRMAEERRVEREKIAEKMKKRANNLQSTGTPRAENAAVRREEILMQHRERLKKEIQKLKALSSESE
ncbi:hypothetical protein M408DRAFT_328668 [Serendipita vermifera MAFF 305830]|uniref:Outer kinetochore protein SPC19 n=1 Tax=Serendipita vermifera MAFF 305830 TaxID=933852 RepID=A0A0C3AXW7_SERVB|nr:hypothetical protein M408DRAFT_328668 [Serendipita vermifera MAFF 305830]